MFGAVPYQLWLLVAVIVSAGQTEAVDTACPLPAFLYNATMSCVYQCPDGLVGDHVTGRCETFDVAKEHYTNTGAYRNIAGTLVAFNATMYMANISRAAPVGTVILSVGLTMSRTAAPETYSVSTPIGVSQPPEPYKIESSGQNRGQLSVKAMITQSQVIDVPYKAIVRCDFPDTSAAITADLEVQVVKTLGPCASGTSGCEHNCFTIANSYRCGCNAGFTLNADRHKCDDIDECQPGGNSCTQTCSNTVGSYQCNCTPGYSLQEDGVTCTDIDECQTGEHNCSQTCSNTVGSFECGCMAGYSLQDDKVTCTDIDECEPGKSNCSQTCSNTVGSFKCGCMAGYSLDLDNSTCTDINECERKEHNCSQLCDNVPGGFVCECEAGYSLQGDSVTCTDIDECEPGRNNCSQTCTNTVGSFECGCLAGYSLQEDGVTCTDIDECQSGRNNCSQTCSNTVGSFECGCGEGHTLQDDSVTCTDIDECQIGRSNCSQTCFNTVGSFKCGCMAGYSLDLDNSTCTDINECERSEHNCSQVCDNVPGGFVCGCEAGYSLQGDGVTCTDIDECQSGRNNCSQTCFNTVGSFKCGCMAGYSLDVDNSTCTDIDECEPGRNNCSQTCSNTVGSFECGCMAGYSLDVDNSTCTDINECERSEHNCSQLCDNVPGGFVCGCEAGYSLQEDGVTCTDVNECQSGRNNCSQTCSNTVGSFQCGCLAGYSLQEDEVTCADIDECQSGGNNCSQTCSNTVGSFECGCMAGYSLQEDEVTCTDLRNPEAIGNLSQLLTKQNLTAENAEELLGKSVEVAKTLNDAMNNVNSNNSEFTERLIDAVTSLLSQIVSIRNQSRVEFNVTLSAEEEEELNDALVGTLGQVLSENLLRTLNGSNETQTNLESDAVTDLVSVAEDIGVSVASGLEQEQTRKTYTSGNLTLQVGLASNSTFHTNIGEYAAVNLSASSLTSSKGEPLAVVTMALGSIGRYFPSKSTVLGEVVSIQLANTSLGRKEMLNISDGDAYPVQISFPTIVDSENVTCGFYKFQTMHSPAVWSTEGVVKGSCSSGVCCQSNHLTNFAVLVNIGGVRHTDEIEAALQWLSYIGCGLSIVCLLVTIVALSVFRYKGQKTPLNFVHINLSVVLFLALCLFVGGGWYLRKFKIPCAIVAGVLHYLFLAVFAWMLCEGVMLYLLLVKVFTRLPKRLWFFALLGYGIPILPVVVTVGARYDFYGSTVFGCWLSPRLQDRTIWGFVVPAALIIIINSVFLVMVVVQVCKSQKNSAARDTANTKVAASTVKATVLLLPLLGLSWAFGYVSIPSVATSHLTLAFQIIFIILNSSQGIAIFVFYVLRNDMMLPLWRRCCPRCMKTDSSSSPSTKKVSTLQMGTFSVHQQASIAVETKEEFDDLSLKSNVGSGSGSITETALHLNSIQPSTTSDAEEQTVAVALPGADDASITDCEFHIQEAVITSSVAVHCDHDTKL